MQKLFVLDRKDYGMIFVSISAQLFFDNLGERDLQYISVSIYLCIYLFVGLFVYLFILSILFIYLFIFYHYLRRS